MIASHCFRRKAFLAVAFLAFLSTARAQQMLPDPQPLGAVKMDIASFEKMETARLARADTAIQQIMQNHAAQRAATIENTLVPYDAAIQELDAATDLAALMQQVHPDTAFRDHATAMNTRVSGAATALSLNQDVYHALSSLDLSGADPATRYYVQRQLLEFRQAGVDKDDAARKRLKELNKQLSEEQSMFDRNISDGEITVEVANAAELAGLPEDYVASHKPGADGKIRITTNYPDLFPALMYARSEDLRRRLMIAFGSRAYPKNRAVLRSMMQTRYEIATLLGYDSWANYNAADKMIGSGKNIAAFLQTLDTATRPYAEREAAMLLAEKRKTHPGAQVIEMFDDDYYSELVRRSQYHFDSTTVRPYLAYDRVKQGILDTAASLFHLTFRRVANESVWDPSVETWEVLDSGRVIGRFYLDMHPRPGKYSHAEMAPVLDGIRGKQLPEAALVCNFAQPTATDPGLMDYDDVVTFFHEFGHLMHHILGGQQAYAGISGITMEQDFVEAPSQMLEEWMHSPEVLASFARDYRTGKPMPADLIRAMNRASAFGRAGSLSAQGVGFQVALAAISYNVYRAPPQSVDIDQVVSDALRKYTVFPPLAGTHFDASFSHLGGYSSAYYTYMWDKVIAEDFFQQFDQKHLLSGEAPMRYRRTVLEPGGSMSANDLVRNFLGRPQDTKAFEHWLGEEFTTP